MSYITKNFTTEEMTCGCGCGVCVDLKFCEWLQRVRDDFGRPMKVTSAARCQAHNKDVGGKNKSAHVDGLAVDIEMIYPFQRYDLVGAAIRCGATGIGIYKTHIHLDRKDRITPALWIDY